jgi:hypothetical protein
MNGTNKIKGIVRDKKGASVIFVLGVMVFLMAIGISVLVAATTTGMSSPIKQKEHEIHLLKHDSVHRNVMYSLQADPTDENGFLSAQIVRLLYDEWDNLDEGETLDDLVVPVVAQLDNGNHLNNAEVSFSFRNVNVNVTEAIPAVLTLVPDMLDLDGFPMTWKLSFEYFDNGYGKSEPRIPHTATVTAEMVVSVRINDGGFVMLSEAVYRFTGGYFSDDPEGILHYDNDTVGFVGDMLFTDDGYGEWEMIGYAIIENLN